MPLTSLPLWVLWPTRQSLPPRGILCMAPPPLPLMPRGSGSHRGNQSGTPCGGDCHLCRPLAPPPSFRHLPPWGMGSRCCCSHRSHAFGKEESHSPSLEPATTGGSGTDSHHSLLPCRGRRTASHSGAESYKDGGSLVLVLAPRLCLHPEWHPVRLGGRPNSHPPIPCSRSYDTTTCRPAYLTFNGVTGDLHGSFSSIPPLS